jgi:ankyrin repeat protein
MSDVILLSWNKPVVTMDVDRTDVTVGTPTCPDDTKVTHVDKQLSINPETLKCPISHDIFYDPVIAMDGIVYERALIENWFLKSSTSPIKRCEMKDDLIECIFVKNLVEEFLQKHPEFKCEQYKPNLSYSFNKQRITACINDRRFDKLSMYHNFDLADMISAGTFDYLIQTNNMRSIIHVLDNAIDIDAISGNGVRALHKICQYGNVDMLGHILTKKIDINAPQLDNWTPLMLLCRYGSFESLKLFTERDGINYDGIEGMHPLLIIAEHGNIESIRLILTKVKEFKVVNQNGRNFTYILRRNKKSNSDERRALITELIGNRDIMEMVINDQAW